MTFPSLLLGILIASLYGALFHLVRGGDWKRLLLYLFLSLAGFAFGHLVGAWCGWLLFPIGVLDFGMATIGSIMFLGLSLINFRHMLGRDDAV